MEVGKRPDEICVTFPIGTTDDMLHPGKSTKPTVEEAPMVVSSLIIETLPNYAEAASQQLAQIPNVEVCGIQDYQLMVTIVADTVHESHSIVDTFISIDGVRGANLIYANFEDGFTSRQAVSF